MSCCACNTNEALTCGKCVSQSLLPLKSELQSYLSEIESKRSKLSSLLSSLSSSKLAALQLQSSIHQRSQQLIKDTASLQDLRSSLSLKQAQLASLRASLSPLSPPPQVTTDFQQKLERLRRALIKKSAEIYEINVYFPEYCISDMFKIEKCMSYSQIIKDEAESVSVDKPNFVISLKNMIISYQSEEHNQAVNFSIAQIAFFLNAVSWVLNCELPFPMTYKRSHFQIKNWEGTKLALNILEPYECENALIYLYENLRVLQQHAGVDFSKIKGVFDIKGLVDALFLGRLTDIPSLPSTIAKEEVKKKPESEEEDWEILDESD